MKEKELKANSKNKELKEKQGKTKSFFFFTKKLDANWDIDAQMWTFYISLFNISEQNSKANRDFLKKELYGNVHKLLRIESHLRETSLF